MIRTVDSPYSKEGGIAVMRGNLAPDGAVVKQSAVAPEMQVKEGGHGCSTLRTVPSRLS